MDKYEVWSLVQLKIGQNSTLTSDSILVGMSFKSSRPNALASLRLKCSSRLKLLAAAQMIKLNSNLKRSKVNWIELNFNLQRMKGWLCNLQPPFFHRIFAILLWKEFSKIRLVEECSSQSLTYTFVFYFAQQRENLLFRISCVWNRILHITCTSVILNF